MSAGELTLDKLEAQKLLRALPFKALLPLHGQMLLPPTGELSIHYTDAEGRERSRRFDFLADRFLRDPSFPAVVYPVGPALRAALPPYKLSN